MRVFLQTKNGQFVNENVYSAYYGFNQLGYEIIKAFYKEDEDESKQSSNSRR
mgnify:CR=1 FL=1